DFKSHPITKIKAPGLPDDLIIGIQELPGPSDGKEGGSDYRKAERSAGRNLIRRLVREEIGNEEFDIFGSPNQKPQGWYGEQLIHISISHVRGLIGGAISEKRFVGLDLERKNRVVHPGLKKRILHPDEKELTDDHISVLQLWTLKESALKWCGSGLRTAMNKICVTTVDQNRFRAVFDDGKTTEIYALDFNDHWISVAYGSDIQ
ncbi:MAG: 4'-phosphopantetheinyl transferase superfamily protein, partial [Balneolaceae bacterium]